MEPREEILKAIKDYHDKTGGSCGLASVELLRITGLTYNEAKPFIIELQANKEIHITQGLNHKLLMYGSKKKR
jgi:hypothetical protein